MKKNVLLLAATLCFSAISYAIPSVNATFPQTLGKVRAGRVPASGLTVPLRTPGIHPVRNHRMAAPGAENTLSMNWGYCEGLYDAMQCPAGEVRMAIRLTAEQATAWAGAELSAIQVGNPADISTRTPNYELGVYEYKNPVRDVTVWISESLDDEPFITKTGTLGEMGLEWSTFELDEPYVLEAGKELIIGYTLDVPDNKNLYSIVNDYSYNYNNDSDLVYWTYKGIDEDNNLMFGDEYNWTHIGPLAGNVAVRARLSGDMLPVDEVSLEAWQGSPYVKPGDDGLIQAIYRNLGANDITSLQFTVEVRGMEPQKVNVELGYEVPYFEYTDILNIPFSNNQTGNNIPYEFYLSGINGTPVDKSDDAVYGSSYLSILEGYVKNPVIEEATGTWCGWCVVGLAGMDYMRQNYDEEGFIGIAMHGMDQMDVFNTDPEAGEQGCYGFLSPYVSGFPSAFMNRDMPNDIYPSPEYLEDYWLYGRTIPAYASISAEVKAVEVASGETARMNLTTRTKFAGTEESADYSVAYVVIEDNVGPYMQTNYTSGMTEDYYGYESKPAYIRTYFTDVARNCSRPDGVAGSLPASVTEGEEYTYATDIDLDGVDNIEFIRVVAMVINNATGIIENATMVGGPDYSGVGRLVASGADRPFAAGAKGSILFLGGVSGASVYTVDGRCVASHVDAPSVTLPAGAYIVTSGNRSVKVMVK